MDRRAAVVDSHVRNVESKATPQTSVKRHLTVNCDGEHPAYSRSCPNWKKEKEARKHVKGAHHSTPQRMLMRRVSGQHRTDLHTPSSLAVVPPAPEVAAVKSAPPTKTQRPAWNTPGSSGLKTTAHQGIRDGNQSRLQCWGCWNQVEAAAG
ncbi:uncharacterized protein LOC142592576 [Dermacentor variabilis]|uniref:uncharacterized protein LOC142592576 n=1 Tax=Dermacentor variabilis TaxID=34621 RepID=UPI003F5B01A7